MTAFANQVINGLASGASYGIFGIAFGLVFASVNVLNVAFSAFATLGAITALYSADHFTGSLWVAVAIGTLCGAGISLLMETLVLRPVRSRATDTFGLLFMASIGCWILLDNLSDDATGHQVEGYPLGMVPDGRVHVGSLSIAQMQLVEIGALVVCATVLHQTLRRTRFGAAVRAVGYSPLSASLGGVNPAYVFANIAIISGALAGLDGALASAATSNVSTALGAGLLLKGFAAVIIGGFGNIVGTAMAGLGIGISEVLFAQYVSTGFRDALTFGLLLVFLILRPQGIFGKATMQRA